LFEHDLFGKPLHTFPDHALRKATLWKLLWQKWTIDKPAAFGDWLHQTLVVELAALLDRLTLRQVKKGGAVPT
jgi:hypothetical protein